jgi:glycosyltransferase involved in cell wall biosynthesis
MLGSDKDLSYRVTNYLAYRFIVVSEKARQHMIDEDGIPARKVMHIKLAYDFSLYPQPSPASVERLRSKAGNNFVLLTVGLQTLKRPLISLSILKSLSLKGVSAVLFLLGRGDAESELKGQIERDGLADRVFLEGYVNNVMDYLGMADILIHPSITEASCVIVKEAGISQVPAIVVKGVGDFDEYMVNGDNGYLFEAGSFATDAVDTIAKLAENKIETKRLGANLNKTVRQYFSIDQIASQYEPLNNP